ncbi:MAG: hypothetical protein SPI30_02575 [Prevotella sp.]|nr:hypothetical protein [Prevotella sp.]
MKQKDFRMKESKPRDERDKGMKTKESRVEHEESRFKDKQEPYRSPRSREIMTFRLAKRVRIINFAFG